jgi:hypothetical protein
MMFHQIGFADFGGGAAKVSNPLCLVEIRLDLLRTLTNSPSGWKGNGVDQRAQLELAALTNSIYRQKIGVVIRQRVSTRQAIW